MKYRLIDIINPLKWRAVYQAYKKKKEGITLAYCEQVVQRSILCGDCVKAGHCVGPCNCTMPDALLAKDNFCSEGKWGPMLDPVGWNKYKQKNYINFKS
jgi:hypothetical protein